MLNFLSHIVGGGALKMLLSFFFFKTTKLRLKWKQVENHWPSVYKDVSLETEWQTPIDYTGQRPVW